MVWVLGQFYENTALFYWFQGQNLLGDDQNSKKGGEVKKGEDQISRGEYFFLFLSIKSLVPFCSCFSGYYTKGEIPRTKSVAALLL